MHGKLKFLSSIGPVLGISAVIAALKDYKDFHLFTVEQASLHFSFRQCYVFITFCLLYIIVFECKYVRRQALIDCGLNYFAYLFNILCTWDRAFTIRTLFFC